MHKIKSYHNKSNCARPFEVLKLYVHVLWKYTINFRPQPLIPSLKKALIETKHLAYSEILEFLS